MGKKNVLLELLNISKKFDDEIILDNINLYINKNEFLTLLGPSGCGKTTTLRIIGGFEEASSGDLMFEGKRINDLPPYERQLNTVFQKYALFPHMTIAENIAFGLKVKKIDRNIINKKVAKMLDLVNLKGFENRDTASLSGGQQQRIAIARALINEPKVLLLDEPLGALDLKLRKDMQIELKSMQEELGITFIYVTHDQEEALTMSDTIAVMNNGKIQQIGTAVDIYNEPKNAFVADFIGESNILDGIMKKDYLVEFLSHDFACLDKGFKENEKTQIVIRPEDVDIVSLDNGQLKGYVESVIFKGVHYEMTVKTNSSELLVHSTDLSEEGSQVGIKIDPDGIHVMKKSELPK